MYGLVNNGIRSLILSQHGQATWDEIRAKAGIDLEEFLAMEPYPDAITYDLVGAASEILQTPAPTLLRVFGRYWIRFTGEQGYGPMMQLSGRDLSDFLDNLDAMHARVALSFPSLEPPSFECESQSDGSALLHYHSSRPGLAPMVQGLVEGLGEQFEEPVSVELLPDPGPSGEAIFRVRIGPASNAESDAA